MTPRAKLERLAGRVPAPVVWLGLPSESVAEVVGHAGARLALVDTEHAAIGVETMAGMIRGLASSGASALVRVPELSDGAIKRALDAGAAGVMVPSVETADQAEAAVRASLYAPEGARGFAGAVRATGYGAEPDYLVEWNSRAFTVVQIESRRGVAAARDIAAVDGVDMLFFGPFDYSRDAGIDPMTEGEALASVLVEISGAARAEARLTGVFPWPGAEIDSLLVAGADLVAVAHDARVLAGGIRAAIEKSGLQD